MENKRVGMLKVVGRLPGSKYLCRCDCGGERIANVGHFNTGKIRSCGCYVGVEGRNNNWKRIPIDQASLKELFDYDGAALIWRERPLETFKTASAHKTWNAKFAGKAAGGQDSLGYVRVNIQEKHHLAHRLIFLREYGWLPEEIDHINHIPSDNRLSNLRAATHRINQKNQKLCSNNTSGRIGVSRFRDKWQSYIRVNSRTIHLGHFDVFEDACSARAKAEAKYGFHKNHGKAL